MHLKISDNKIVNRLRWIMVGSIIFSIINTLLGQPEAFWSNPADAIRGDGLSIYNTTNYTFSFFLGNGWLEYVFACVVYIIAAFLLVSFLPRRIALITELSFIFGYFFEATNWLAVRWHFGINAAMIFGILISLFIVFNLFEEIRPDTDKILKKLRWVMLGTMVLDFLVTLIGQPHSFWIHPDTVHEGNPLSRFFLLKGWYYFAIYDLVYFTSIFLLVSYIPKRLALFLIFYFILIHFVGDSCWFFYEWRMGMQSPVIIGIILSSIIVMIYESEISISNNGISVST